MDLLMRTIMQFLQLGTGWRCQNGADDLHCRTNHSSLPCHHSCNVGNNLLINLFIIMNTTRHGAGAGLWIADKLHKYLGSFLLSSVELYFKHEHNCQDKMHFLILHIFLQFDNNSSFTFFFSCFLK